MRFLMERLMVKCRIAVILVAVFFSVSSFAAHPDRDSRAKQINLIIRQIGHQLLLQAGDSGSRVMPVTESRPGTFVLSFENEFVFSHDSLWYLTNELLPASRFPSGYTVTVHDCNHGYIVYGFEVNGPSPDILACVGRHQAPGCYTIEFAFNNLYAVAEVTKAHPKKTVVDDIAAEHESPLSAAQNDNEIVAESGDGTDTDELPVTTDAPIEDSTLAVTKVASFGGGSLPGLVSSTMLVMLGIALFVVRLREFLSYEMKRDITVTEETHDHLPSLGKFLFDVTNQRLLIGGEVISLTDKECKILELLNQNYGELISRDELMQQVWINEGVITGRSLDMFVSKLRKKLSRDPELRITNVHGKGYKLVAQSV